MALAVGCAPVGSPDTDAAGTPGIGTEPGPTAPPPGRHDGAAGAADPGERDPSSLTRALNEDLTSFIERAGYRPGGGDHDWMNASNSIRTRNGVWVSLFVFPLDQAGLGDVTFERTETTTHGDDPVHFGHRSDGQAAAQFDCGSYQFQFFAEDGPAVREVARAVAGVVTCPYEPG